MKFLKFAKIAKVDVAKREVWGVAAEEAPDKAGEIMDYATTKSHFLAWSEEISKATGGKSLGNVRAMHNAVAAGKLIHLEPRDDEKQVYVGAHIVDDNEWNKVVEGVYTGFSIGGDYVRRWPDADNPTLTRYEGRPNEISLVDNPAQYGAHFEIVKADGSTVMRKFVPLSKQEQSLDEQARRIRETWYGRFNPEREFERWVREVFADRIIVEREDGLYAYSVLEEAGEIVFGDPYRVELVYQAVEETAAPAEPPDDEPMAEMDGEAEPEAEPEPMAQATHSHLRKQNEEETEADVEQGDPESEPEAMPPAATENVPPTEPGPQAEPDVPPLTVEQVQVVEQVVTQMLVRLGILTQRDDGEVVVAMARAVPMRDLQKSVTGHHTALEKLTGDLKTAFSDLAKIALAIEALESEQQRQAQLVAQGGPVLREISVADFVRTSNSGSGTIEELNTLLKTVVDPQARDAIGRRLAELQIRDSQTRPMAQINTGM